MPNPGSYADVNGLRMYYEVHGEGQPLVVLHGGTCSIELPGMEIPFFASEFQVIAPEQMGHGRTNDGMDRDRPRRLGPAVGSTRLTGRPAIRLPAGPARWHRG